MSAAKKQYRTIAGVVQFEPKEGEAAGQDVRNIVVKQVGFGQQAVNVYATLWPKHEDFAVERGDFVVLEGSYTSRDGQNQTTGEAVTYHNVSIMRILNLGALDNGVDEEVVTKSKAKSKAKAKEAPAEDLDEDDIPF